MEGFLLTFYTQQNRMHGDLQVANWILEEARQLGIRGATLATAREGFGHDGRFHSENYFDLEDRPQQVVMAVTEDECNHLLGRLEENGPRVFYTKSRIEFGFTGEPGAS
ncbi:DUF190 domain-containing protein [Pseudodesulfovibrio cashew]|uniref:DUF190 domain-containing protein n=1 Tax=Pseudodesulfovibrio cashew TaxID=2678688 RepID=A0A6I6JIY3_9BACT|nr:DUF190 domain-containing protein [Pseudodesulfovibrio cashew]QGY40908.1 DUF190 domain-containing protein [Pseudodesulfovibrio cashew]